MTNINFLLLIILFNISCKTAQNKTIENKGDLLEVKENDYLAVVDKINVPNQCIVCHHATNTGVGPSYTEVAKIYKEKNGNLVKFLKDEAKPIVDTENFFIMQINLKVIKKLSDKDIAIIAAYIRSFE